MNLFSIISIGPLKSLRLKTEPHFLIPYSSLTITAFDKGSIKKLKLRKELFLKEREKH